MATSIVLVSLVFLLAGFVKGVIGMGLPTVAIGLLGTMMAPAQAAALLVVPSFVTNVWQLMMGPGFLPLLRRLWPMLLGVCVGTLSAVAMPILEGGPGASMLLGIALMLYALIGLSARQLSVAPRVERWLALIVGLLTGAVTAATGVFVLPAVPYLQALQLERDELVQALGLSFTVSTVALGIVLLVQGSLQASVATMSFGALLPALAGMYAGQWLRGRIRPEVFRRYFFVGLLLLGGQLALRAIAP